MHIIYSTWCLRYICLVIPILCTCLLLFIQSLYSLSKLQFFHLLVSVHVNTICKICRGDCSKSHCKVMSCVTCTGYFSLQITIPSSDTTYWCAAFQLPEKIRRQTRYITKVSKRLLRGSCNNVCMMGESLAMLPPISYGRSLCSCCRAIGNDLVSPVLAGPLFCPYLWSKVISHSNVQQPAIIEGSVAPSDN